MTALVWDAAGERAFQAGVDRGVLGLQDGSVVPWNGIISVDEAPNSELKSVYLDGVKISESLSPGDFVGKLKAYMWPDEFDEFNGIVHMGDPGLSFYEQKPKKFNLSYRTQKGNDENSNSGYVIHFLYNLVADPDSVTRETLTDSTVTPIEFGWSLTGVPSRIDQVRPMVHISVDSTTTDPDTLAEIEELLYGSESSDGEFPAADVLAGFFGYIGSLIIVDHGDGTWSATGQEGYYIIMDSDTEFTIQNVEATYSDVYTFDVESTFQGWT